MNGSTAHMNRASSSATAAIIAGSVTGGLLVLCIASLCIMIIMIKKYKAKKTRHGIFTIVSM